MLLQTSNCVRPDLFPFLGRNTGLDHVTRSQRGQIEMNIARQEPLILLRDLSIGVNNYLLPEFREIRQTRPSFLVRDRVFTLRIEDECPNVGTRRVQLRDQELDKVRLAITRVRKDVRPSANKPLHVKRDWMI